MEKFLPQGITAPDLGALNEFWKRAVDANEELAKETDFRVRWIGLDEETTLQIFALIESGDKTGTFTLPWIVERTAQPTPAVGDDIVLVDIHGVPRQVVRLTRVDTVSFGQITEEHTAIDGPPVRALEVWKPLHFSYWNQMLEPYGLRVRDDMPVWIEPFRFMYGE